MTLNYKELYEDLLSDYYEVLSERNQAFADRRELAKTLRDERSLSGKLLEGLIECNHKLGDAQSELVLLRENISRLDYDLWVLTSPELAQL